MLNMNANLLAQKVETIHGRLFELYKDANASPSLAAELLPIALKELGIASEEVQVAIDELALQNEQLITLQAKAKLECQRYQRLFEALPMACLVTDSNGVIKAANHAAAELFNIQQQFMIGKPVINWVVPEEKLYLRSKLTQLAQQNRSTLSVRFQRRYDNPFDAALTLDAVHNPDDDSLVLYWMLSDVTEHKRAKAALEQPNYDLMQDRPLHRYSKGDAIPLEPQSLWLVIQGTVKLTTFSENGEEMLIGLSGPSTVFGPDLTALQTYQAIALTEVQLVFLALTEVAQSPRLSQALLPAISQRLRQTESFLAIYGQLRVEDRLNCLLQLLKHEAGEPVDEGVRIQIRLTHQDLASVCCTTRVTITRLLGKLQQQGQVVIDAQNHLILKE
jgi:PAS domain S-box-containing protein